jgi:hypothetical protein
MKWYADTDNDCVRPERKGDATNMLHRTAEAAWCALMDNATYRCASAGNCATNARAELRKLEERALKEAERLNAIMDAMPWPARQFRERALMNEDKALSQTPDSSP